MQNIASTITQTKVMTAGVSLLRSGANLFSDIMSGEQDIKTALNRRGGEGIKRDGQYFKSIMLDAAFKIRISTSGFTSFRWGGR